MGGFSHWLKFWNSVCYQRTFCDMKRLRSAIACAALCALTVAPRATEKQPLVVVSGPTVVAFFEPVPPAKLDKDADANEALADFQFYARSVRASLKKQGIEFHELYTHSFGCALEPNQ